MQVVILGAGTAIPARQRSPAGIWVSVRGEQLLFDAGPGTVQRLHQAGGSVFDLDRIFLTHYHLDHCLDLASALFALRIPSPARSKPLVVYGPPGLQRLHRQLNRAFHGRLSPKTFRLQLREIERSTLRFNGYTVASRPMRHAAPAVGYRIDSGGRSVAYSGDTDVCRELIELGRRANVLIVECSMPDERKVEGHLTPTECGRIAAQAEAKHLVLTHFYPVVQGYPIRRRVRRAFAGRLTLARDLTALRV